MMGARPLGGAGPERPGARGVPGRRNMTKPTILAVDDDAAVSRAIVRDLRMRYGSDYRILRATSGDEALALMRELALKGRPLALVVSDQRMPGMTGIELLGRVRAL